MYLKLAILQASLATALYRASSAVFIGSSDADWSPGPLLQPGKPCGGQSYDPYEASLH